jgi:alanine or glycine:cation symporter, AGCS family
MLLLMTDLLNAVNNVLWHDSVLYIVLGTGILFTIWSGFSQYRALTHGTAVVRGKYDNPTDPGAINHFQALSTALSATVGLGNIAGVALAIALGGPGAVFWMWVIGVLGMAIKTTEVTLAMLYRNTDDPENPHGGPMWVAKEGFKRMGYARLGSGIGGIFCVTVIISAVTGGNMFQAWNVAEITNSYFPTVPKFVCGVLVAIIVGMVIIGGIKRIGAVAGRLVPVMCILYMIAAVYITIANLDQVPAMLRLIFTAAFSQAEAQNAFLGGTAGFAFLWGMKRALFSSEAGQGSAPIAHAAAKTNEPVREGVVAGLEPFIDTLVVCTLSALVILLSGAWNREPEAYFSSAAEMRVIPAAENGNGRPLWTIETPPLPPRTAEAKRIHSVFEGAGWRPGEIIFMVLHADENRDTGFDLRRIMGTVFHDDGQWLANWGSLAAEQPPVFQKDEEGAPRYGIYGDYVGAALTGHAFDRVMPGLGMWLVTAACWLFAISSVISWSYYGEQGVIYLFRGRGVMAYKLAYCALAIVATLGFMRTDEELDAWTALGTGVMLFANIPIMLIFGYQAMRAYHDYMRRFKSGQMTPPHRAPPIADVIEGKEGR